MADGPQTPELTGSQTPEMMYYFSLSPTVGAVYLQGRDQSRARSFVRKPDGKGGFIGEVIDMVPILDVTISQDRRRWALEDMRVFADGTTSNPEKQWKEIIDNWLTELRFSASRAKLGRKELKETESDIMAMMAVSASARAMEISAGSATVYANHIIPGGERGPDTDKQDSWAEFLLHKDARKLERVLYDPLVAHYYERLIADAGINNPKRELKKDKEFVGLNDEPIKEGEKPIEVYQVGGNWKVVEKDEDGKESNNIDSAKAHGSQLKKYLMEKHRPDGYIAGYITDFLLASDTDEFIEEQGEKGLEDTARWAAAKLACDAFLVDKYTRWELALEETAGSEKERANIGKEMKPTPGWGGDPLRSILEPAFLPRTIKEMYKGEEGAAILSLMDRTFRPDDLFRKEGIEHELLQASMVTGIKNIVRYNDAIWAFLGSSSRASGIPMWTRDAMEALPKVVELMDQVYGVIEDKKTGPIGKHIMGAFVARMIYLKASAAVIESANPNSADRLAYLTEAKGGDYFEEARAFLLGPKFDGTEGYLYQLKGRTGIILKGNIFPDARESLTRALEMLEFNVSEADEINRGRFYRRLKGVLIFLQGLGAEKIRR